MKTKTPEELEIAFERWRSIRDRCSEHPAYTKWDPGAAKAHLILGLVRFASDEVADHCLRYWATQDKVLTVYPSEQLKKQATRACRNLMERRTEGWGSEENLDASFDDGVWSREYWAWKWETAMTGTVDLVCRRHGLSFDDLDSVFDA